MLYSFQRFNFIELQKTLIAGEVLKEAPGIHREKSKGYLGGQTRS